MLGSLHVNSGLRDGLDDRTFSTKGESDMGDTGKKDKGKREQQKKAQHTLKEKRKLKNEKKKQGH